MSEYISIADAVVITGKSSSTIRRVVKRLESEAPPDTVRKETTSQGDKYLVKRETLWKALGIEAGSTPDIQVDVTSPQTDLTEKLIETLSEQLRVKDEQLQEKDKQINQLLERQRELTILANISQQKVLQLTDTTVSTHEKPAEVRRRENIILLVAAGFLLLIFGLVFYFSYHPF